MIYYVVIACRDGDWYMPHYDVNKSISTDREEMEKKAKLWASCNRNTKYKVVEVNL
jgi:hypothetical protein